MRFSTHVVLFILVANALVGAAGAIDMWSDWGIEVDTGVSPEQINNTKTAFNEITVGGLGGQTLINLFVFGAKALQTGWQLVTALPGFLENIGVPGFIAAIPNAALVVLVGRDVLQVLLGRVI